MDIETTEPTGLPEPPESSSSTGKPWKHEAPAPRRRGAARERRARRKDRLRGISDVGRHLPDLPTQLRPSGAVTLPDINWRQLRLPVYIVGGLLIFGLMLLFLSRFTGGDDSLPPNALWLGTEWSYGLDESASMDDLAARLREHDVGTVYAWVSWLQTENVWAGRTDLENNFNEVSDDVRAFVTDFKAAYPEANLYGWVSVPVGTEPGGRDISDPNVQQAVATFSQFVVQDLGFDGVFLNVELVFDGNQDFLSLLGVVRDTLGTEAFIAAAIPPDWSPLDAAIPVPPLIEPGTEWSAEYKKNVALLVDELAVMAYNSGLSDQEDYIDWVAYQVAIYADTIAELDTGTGPGVRIVIGIPTYDTELPGHDATVENIPTAIRGVRAGLEAAGDNARYVNGVAIYADWTSDDVEWAQFYLNWVDEN